MFALICNALYLHENKIPKIFGNSVDLHENKIRKIVRNSLCCLVNI